MMVMLEYGAHKLVAYLGWIGIMLLIGMILRAKIPFLKNWLVPSAIIGGLIGFVLINTGVLGLDVAMFSTIAGQLFTLGFISIGLTEADKEQGKSAGDWFNLVCVVRRSVITGCRVLQTVEYVYRNFSDTGSWYDVTSWFCTRSWAGCCQRCYL